MNPDETLDAHFRVAGPSAQGLHADDEQGPRFAEIAAHRRENEG